MSAISLPHNTRPLNPKDRMEFHIHVLNLSWHHLYVKFAPCMEGLRLGAPLAQTGRVMGKRESGTRRVLPSTLLGV